VKDTAALITKAMARDAPLVERHEAFGEIVRRFQDLAYGCAYAVLNDFYLAQDAAQEAFIAAWQRLDQLRQPEAFPGWFRRIVLTECNRMTRGKRVLFMPLEAGLDIPSSQADPHTLAERTESAEQVLAAIGALPEPERMVTALFYINELSQSEISAFLELPTTTVAKRLYSARRRLMQKLLQKLRGDLQEYRPSKDAAFVDQVKARLRPLAVMDWELATALAHAFGDFRAGDDLGLRNSQQVDDTRYIRRRYVAEHAETQQVLAYGSIEQTVFLPQYRLFLVVDPKWLRRGVGDLLLDRLMADLREANAITVWHRNYAERSDLLAFLRERGFVEAIRVWDLRLNVLEANLSPFRALGEQMVAHNISITTMAEERKRDAESVRKLHEFLNVVKADDPGRQPFLPVPFEAVEPWFSRPYVLPDACFIAKHLDKYVGFTDLNLLEAVAGGLTHGFTGVAREYRRQGVATALKLRTIEYAREHGYQTIRAFNRPCHAALLALNERLGFRRAFSYVTLEKCLKEVAQVDPSIYDAYVGRYWPDRTLLSKYGLPSGFAVTIKKVGDRLFSEVRDMQDELFPASETEFFIKDHYGQGTFMKDDRGQVTHLVYREAGMVMRADKLRESF
jgi:RNA polymerase sigma factor (sigma-70 family)